MHSLEAKYGLDETLTEGMFVCLFIIYLFLRLFRMCLFIYSCLCLISFIQVCLLFLLGDETLQAVSSEQVEEYREKQKKGKKQTIIN
jgi:hypothetical protein